jgi:hypothetical protein
MESWWDLFGVLMIVLGCMGVVMRFPVVISPGWAKTVMRWMLRHRVFIHVAMLIFAILGATLIWGARNISELRMQAPLWSTWVMFVLGVLMASAGLLFLAFPRLYVAICAYLKAMSNVTIRLLAMLGVAVSALIAYSGYALLQ